MKRFQFLPLAVTCVFAALYVFPAAATTEGTTRTYYIAVDEIEWDYTPMGVDQMMGMPFDKMAKMYVESDKHQIGRVYRKAVYREYTDATFTTVKPRTPEWEHLGLLGPALHQTDPDARNADAFWEETYLYSRAASVYGGTRQIQRNIIADRVLALPAGGGAEPRARKAV